MGLGFKGSEFSAAAGRRSGRFDQNRDIDLRSLIRAAPLAKKTASLIGKETMPF